MNLEENRDALQPKDASSTNAETEQETPESLELSFVEEQPSRPPRVERSGAEHAVEQAHVCPKQVDTPS